MIIKHSDPAASELSGIWSCAWFSDDMRHRFRLWRRWGHGSICNFVMLNPSTADEIQNDPTVERCERRARSWGFDGFEVTNIFALRSTDPRGLREVLDPIGEHNDMAISVAAETAGLIVCAWGNHGLYLNRGRAVRRLLERVARDRIRVLRLSQAGQPCHPLYLPYTLKPVEWIQTNGRELEDRVDGSHLQPMARLHEDQQRVHELLCRGVDAESAESGQMGA